MSNEQEGHQDASSSSAWSCAAPRRITPSCTLGHRKLLCSRRSVPSPIPVPSKFLSVRPAHRLVHQIRQPFAYLAEVDGLHRHHYPNVAGLADHGANFSAWNIAATNSGLACAPTLWPA
jgi:hypothetical protein